MAGASVDPQKIRELSEPSPIGLDKVLDAGNKLGIDDQAIFVILTVFFGLGTIHGVYRMRRKATKHLGP